MQGDIVGVDDADSACSPDPPASRPAYEARNAAVHEASGSIDVTVLGPAAE